MTMSMKKTLQSVIVLMLIALVSIASLALANAFFPKYVPSLDAKTESLIKTIVPGSTKFEMVQNDALTALNADLDKYNSENGTKTDFVLAVYKALDGTSKDCYIIEATAKGYSGNPSIVILTAYDKTSKIIGTVRKSAVGADYFKDKDFNKLNSDIKGKDTIDAKDIATMTGATSKASMDGIAKAINLASGFAKKLNGAAEVPEVLEKVVITSGEEFNKLKFFNAAATKFTKYPISAKDKKIAAVFVDNDGLIIIHAKGDTTGYGKWSLFVTIQDGMVDKVAVSEAVYDIGQDEAGNDWNLTYLDSAAVLTALFTGKNFAAVEAMTSNDITSSATSETSDGIKTNIKNALVYAPLAQDYIDNFGKDGGVL